MAGRVRRRRRAEGHDSRAAQGARRRPAGAARSSRRRIAAATASSRRSAGDAAPGHVAEAPAASPARRRSRRPARPRVSYAHSGSVNIAYQVVGSGPIDLVFVMGWVSHLEYFWNEPLVRAVPRAARVDVAADPVRQARHRAVGSGAGQPAADARTAAGRCARGDGGGRLGARGAARRVRGRTAVQPVRGHVSGEDRGAGHDRQLRAADARRGLSVGTDARGARRVLRDDRRRVGRSGRHRGARPRRGPPIRRFASGGRRTCAWARAPAPPSR